MGRDIEYYVFIRTGAIYEPLELRGISHFVEHVVFNYSLEKAGLNKYLEDNGIEIEAETTEYATIVTFWSLNKNLLRNLKRRIKKIIFNPEITGDAINQEKRIIEEEIAYEETSPTTLGQNQLFSLIFRGTNLEIPVIGNRQLLQKVNLAMIRKWYKRFYKRSNILEIEYNRQTKKIQPSHNKSSLFVPRLQLKNVPQESFRKTLKRNYKSQLLNIGWVIENLDTKGRIALDVLRRMLGAMSTSFIFQDLIQKNHLIYKGDSFIEHFRGLTVLGLQLFSTRPTACLRELEGYKRELLFDLSLKDRFIQACKIEKEEYSESTDFLPYIVGKEFLSTGKLVLPSQRIKLVKNMDYSYFLNKVKKLFSGPQYLVIIE